MQDLLKFIEVENGRLAAYYGNPDSDRRILAQAVKLSEEVGELCEEVLGHLSLQRKPKLDARKNGNLEKEFADVIVVTLLLANTMGVDVKEGLERTIEKVNKRYE